MAYTPQQWQDDNTLSPYGPLSGARLNYIEAGIAAAASTADTATVFVNVKTFGAVGDGVANDAAAINSAIASLPANGGVVWFPTGIYKVNTEITVAGTGVHFMGVGWKKITGASANTIGSIIKAGAAMTNLVSMSGDNCRTTNMCFDGDGVVTGKVLNITSWQFFGLSCAVIKPAAGGTAFYQGGDQGKCLYMTASGNSAANTIGWHVAAPDNEAVMCTASQAATGLKVAGGTFIGTNMSIACPSMTGQCIEIAAGNCKLANISIGNVNGPGVYINPTAVLGDLQISNIDFFSSSLMTDNTFPAFRFNTGAGFNINRVNIANVSIKGETTTTGRYAYAFDWGSTPANLHGVNLSNVNLKNGDTGKAFPMWTPSTYRPEGVSNVKFGNGSEVYSVVPGRNEGVTLLTYGTSIATDAYLGRYFTVTVTDAVAFTMTNPSNAEAGQQITYEILNSSGGAMGAITWNARFKLAGAFTNPASTKKRTISFAYNGTDWLEVARAGADI